MKARQGTIYLFSPGDWYKTAFKDWPPTGRTKGRSTSFTRGQQKQAILKAIQALVVRGKNIVSMNERIYLCSQRVSLMSVSLFRTMLNDTAMAQQDPPAIARPRNLKFQVVVPNVQPLQVSMSSEKVSILSWRCCIRFRFLSEYEQTWFWMSEFEL